ncbi:MAG: hypothetical protein JNK02_07060 [Planctomycetes bacterium]|nr:hypothetical protein [Planctomycetota bacterium]
MSLRPRLASLVLTACALAGSARAQGPVQLALMGEVDRTGGARIEVDVTFLARDGQSATASVALFLAERTSAADLGVLLERRLAAAGLRVLNTGSGLPRPVTCLFVEDVLSVGLRLGHGLRATLTLGEDRAESVRLLAPYDARLDAELRVTASTWMPHERRHARVEYQARLEAAAPPVKIADQLAAASTRVGWSGEIQGHEVWRPGATAAGGAVGAVNFDLQTQGDWRLEVALAPRTQVR